MTNLDELWKEYLEKHTKNAKDKLLVEYSYLVKYTAKRMAVNLPLSVDMNDLIGSGIMGLIRALEKFNPALDVKFETYATYKIRGAILDELRAMDWVPRSVRQKSRMLQRVYAVLENRLGRMPYDDEVAKEMNVSEDELSEMLSDVAPTTIISLEEAMPEKSGGDAKSLKIIDTVEDTSGRNPLLELGFQETKQILKEAITELPEKEKLVVALYHYEELTLKEIGEVLGISESRASQIHSKAVIKLRSRLLNKINT